MMRVELGQTFRWTTPPPTDAISSEGSTFTCEDLRIVLIETLLWAGPGETESETLRYQCEWLSPLATVNAGKKSDSSCNVRENAERDIIALGALFCARPHVVWRSTAAISFTVTPELIRQASWWLRASGTTHRRSSANRRERIEWRHAHS
eukprot:6539368-Prymnesium_polylepis.1